MCVLVLVEAVLTVTARVFPTDPIRSVGTVFTLPNRDIRFDFVDQPSTGDKRFASMGRGGGAHYGNVSDCERPNAMQSRQTKGSKGLCDALHDLAHLFFCHGLVRMVLKQRHWPALVFIAHSPDEKSNPSHFGPAHSVQSLLDSDWFGADGYQGTRIGRVGTRHGSPVASSEGTR